MTVDRKAVEGGGMDPIQARWLGDREKERESKMDRERDEG